MKKLPIYLFISLMTLYSVLGLAKFTFETEYTIPFGEPIVGPCAGGNDYVYCFGWWNESNPEYVRGSIFRYSHDYLSFDWLNYPFESSYENPHGPAWRSDVQYDLNTVCDYNSQNDLIYCMGPDAITAGVYDLNGNIIKKIPDELYNLEWRIDYTTTGQTCAIRPFTEEMWCWGGNTFYLPESDYIRYYDFSDNTTALVKQVSGGASSYGGCLFVDNDNLACWGSDELTSDQIFFYNVETDVITYDTLAMPMDQFSGVCRTYFDVLYCYGFSTDNVIQRKVIYYDLITHEKGILTRELPNDYYFFQNCKPMFNAVKDFCIGGYEGIDWNITNDVFALQWSPCNERWVKNDTECIAKQAFRTYYDAEYCGTYDNLPSDNGTYVKCGGGGGNSAASLIVQENLVKQASAKEGSICQTVDGTGEVIICNTNQFFSRLGTALQQVILNIRKAVGLQ